MGKLRECLGLASVCPAPGCVTAGRGYDVITRRPKDSGVSPHLKLRRAELSAFWCPLRRKLRVRMSAWIIGVGMFIWPGSLLHSHSFIPAFTHSINLYLASLPLSILCVKNSPRTGLARNVSRGSQHIGVRLGFT